jgi:DNA mismatch repair protein MutL
VPEPRARLGPLLGDKLASLVAFRDGTAPWTLHGYVSPPELSFRDRNHLYLFVNGRAVRDRLLLAALASAWEGFFPKGSYPAAVLFLDVPPEAVDVNVHPTKAEVRFREPQRIFPWVGRALREAWSGQRGGLASVLDLPPRPLEPELDRPLAPVAATHPNLWAAETVYPQHPMPARVAEPAEPVPTGALRYLGSFDATYLLAEAPGPEPELWIVDQHVAHERILYERLFLRKHHPAVQPLMPPRVVRVGPEALARLAPFLDACVQAGVEVEPFGEDAVVVRGLPDFLIDRDPEALLADLLQRLEEGGKVDLDHFRRELNAELSCRSAIKKHHHLPADLAQRLIEDLMRCDVPHTCPHGRPVIKKLTRADLERSFGRRA